MTLKFPPVETADPESGLLAYGGNLEVTSLESAYRSGIFPWPTHERAPILWFAPLERTILDFDRLHIPRRLKRDLRKVKFRFKVNQNFAAVIRACAKSKNRKNQHGTWITTDMISAYIRFHEAGFAYSFETYTENNVLVGGMYGVLIEKYFAGESMFFTQSNASKFALLNAMAYLRNLRLTWIDLQMMTPLVSMLGAVQVNRVDFMHRLQEALRS